MKDKPQNYSYWLCAEIIRIAIYLTAKGYGKVKFVPDNPLIYEQEKRGRRI